MNLLDKLSIISPEDAKRLKACYLNKAINAYITDLKQYNIHIDLARIEIRKSIQFIRALTRSKQIKSQIEYILEKLEYMSKESNNQYTTTIDLGELLDDHKHKLMLAIDLDYDPSKDK